MHQTPEHQAADADTARAVRRRTMPVLMDRARHGVLTLQEGELLVQYVEAEMRAADTAPTGRAAVFDDAADQIDAETRRLKADGVLEPDRFRPCRDASAQLRALAAEARGAQQDDEGDELVCVDECGNCDACGMEPFGTPAEGWREAARFLRRTARDSADYLGALRGARLIEDELRRRAEARNEAAAEAQQDGAES